MNLLRSLWHSPSLLNGLTRALIVIATLALLWILAYWVSSQPVFALRVVQVETMGTDKTPDSVLRHVQESDLRQALGAGGFEHALRSPLEPGQSVLMTHPWVRQVAMRRVWPNRLVVRIEEHQPIASWSDGRLLNRYGELFVGERTAASEDAEEIYQCRLINLSGPVGSHLRVLERAVDVDAVLSAYSLSLDSLTLSAQASWSLALEGGPDFSLGREDLPTDWRSRATLAAQTLARVEKWVATNQPSAQVARIDLRYANGFAFSTQPSHSRRQPVRERAASTPSCLHHYRQGTAHAA